MTRCGGVGMVWGWEWGGREGERQADPRARCSFLIQVGFEDFLDVLCRVLAVGTDDGLVEVPEVRMQSHRCRSADYSLFLTRATDCSACAPSSP